MSASVAAFNSSRTPSVRESWEQLVNNQFFEWKNSQEFRNDPYKFVVEKEKELNPDSYETRTTSLDALGKLVECLDQEKVALARIEMECPGQLSVIEADERYKINPAQYFFDENVIKESDLPWIIQAHLYKSHREAITILVLEKTLEFIKEGNQQEPQFQVSNSWEDNCQSERSSSLAIKIPLHLKRICKFAANV